MGGHLAQVFARLSHNSFPQFLWTELERMLNCMAVELNDAALMLRYQDGDVAAFETLYNRHRGPLFRFLLRQIGNQQFAEDVFQEVWSKIIRNRKTYRPAAKFTTYMYHIARNCSVDHHRRTGRQPVTVAEHDEAVPEPVAASGDPALEAQHRDIREQLLEALDSLPADQREVFLLREEGGFTLEEIGTITGTGRETVKSRLRYALRKLRTCVPKRETLGVDND
jgi:RNA polymerase sigma factor (sigma-70 family)